MKQGNVSIFIPHNGCPHRCSFCNQSKITGQQYQPTPAEVALGLEKAANDLGERAKNVEIAFFGGSFTAIDRGYMISLLEAAGGFLDRFYGIRISTRPDCIDNEILDILEHYGVTAIELGAQSMDDGVLAANERGHTANDVVNASNLIKSRGFSLGLQMMTGLYKSSPEKDLSTAERFADLSPDTVRIYPTVIMKGTRLADLYLSGSFKPYTLDESVRLCARLIRLFEGCGINIIRLGLHYSDSLVSGSLGNNYHPAFKELCENLILYENFIQKASAFARPEDVKEVYINPRSLSKFTGQKKCNLKKLENAGYNFAVKFDDLLGKYDLYLI